MTVVRMLSDMSSKSKMIAIRYPNSLFERIDFIARNIDSDVLTTRSAVILAAVEMGLLTYERRLAELGLEPPKRK